MANIIIKTLARRLIPIFISSVANYKKLEQKIIFSAKNPETKSVFPQIL